MITIDEAIAIEKRHYNQLTEEFGNFASEYHKQIAEWLENYKRLSTEKEQDIYERAYRYGQDKGLSDGHFFGYNKAIDDFKKILSIEKIKEYAESDGFINLNNCSLMIYDIAEQLKAGEENV